MSDPESLQRSVVFHGYSTGIGEDREIVHLGISESRVSLKTIQRAMCGVREQLPFLSRLYFIERVYDVGFLAIQIRNLTRISCRRREFLMPSEKRVRALCRVAPIVAILLSRVNAWRSLLPRLWRNPNLTNSYRFNCPIARGETS